jgi:hypothetical protein
MKKILSLTILAAMLAIGAKGAFADVAGPFPSNLTNGNPPGVATPNSGTGEYEVYQALNLLLGTHFTNNAQADYLEVTSNTNVWTQTNNGGYAAISVGAAAQESFEIYSPGSSNTVLNPFGVSFTGDGALGNGTSNPYPGVQSIPPVGSQVGFALSQFYNNKTTDWYSDPTLNSDGMDHMIVYNLSPLIGTQINIYNPNTSIDPEVTLEDPYLLAFEDLPETNPVTGAPSDVDYNDLIVLVDGVTPGTATVPEPMTLALFAVGLMAMVGFTMRRKFVFVR